LGQALPQPGSRVYVDERILTSTEAIDAARLILHGNNNRRAYNLPA
jgi:hypothetical protein